MATPAEIEGLLIRQLSGNSSATDDESIAKWLRESEANRQEYARVKRAWEAAGAPASRVIDVDAEWESFRQRHFTGSKGKVIRMSTASIIRYAAAAVILLGLIIPGLYFSGSDTYITGSGQRYQVSLDDGSEIVLGQNSLLTVPRSYNWFSRNISLEGEASFEVAKNPEKAFEISGPKTITRVLGTAFRLTATTDQNRISVVEGKVAYWAREKTDTLILTQGEMGRLENSELHESAVEAENYDSWKTGLFHFENRPVLNVLEDLQDFYVFSIINPEKFEDVNCRFSGSFDNQSLDEVLDELSLTMGMEYELQGSVLQINKFYCD